VIGRPGARDRAVEIVGAYLRARDADDRVTFDRMLRAAPAISTANVRAKSPPRGQPDPLGSIEELRVPAGAAEGPTIDVPEICHPHNFWNGGAFIRVRGHGTRKLVAGRGCKRPDAGCTEIEVNAFAVTVGERVMRSTSGGGGGAGLGVCSRHLRRPLDLEVPQTRRLSAFVTRWGSGSGSGLGSACGI
jgi:hypothetical protein